MDDGSVRLWRLDDFQPVWTARAHERPVNCVAMDPRGRYVASGCDGGRFHLTSLQTGERVHALPVRPREGFSEHASAVAFSPDGELLVGGNRIGAVYVWRVQTAKLVHQLPGNVDAVAVSQDGRRLAATGSQVAVWDLPDAKLVHQWYLPTTMQGMAVSFRSNDEIALASHRSRIHFYNVASGQETGTIQLSHDGILPCAVVSPSGRYMGFIVDDQAAICDLESKRPQGSGRLAIWGKFAGSVDANAARISAAEITGEFAILKVPEGSRLVTLQSPQR